MKKLGIRAAILVAPLAFGLAACDLGGAGQKAAYVDVEKVIRDSKAGKDLNRQIKAHNDKIIKKARPEQERLQKEQRDLVNRQNSLSPAALRSGETAFRQKAIKFQEKMRKENENLQKGGQEVLSEIEAVLAAIYKELLDKHGIDMIFSRTAILNGDDKHDLTVEVIEILNQRLASVKLTVPTE